MKHSIVQTNPPDAYVYWRSQAGQIVCRMLKVEFEAVLKIR